MDNLKNDDDMKVPKILLVDDLPANLELLISYLSSSYHTAIAKNGLKAIQRAELLQPDLILLDIQMPEMDGFEACKRLKENDSTKDIPVIFMSSLTDTTDKLKGFELGGVDYITKPVNRYELSARINTHLTLKRVQDELKMKNDILKDQAQQRKRVEQILRHDLKSPLQAIINIPDLMISDKNLTNDQAELLEIIHESSINILDMINNSLTLYKIENATYKTHTVSISVVKELLKVINSFKTHRNTSKIIFTKDGKPICADDESCHVLGESMLIYSLFSNLIKNALEASPPEETVEVIVESGDLIKVKIRNKGSVPVEIRDTFFEEFTTSGKEHGTGLGTYSAKLIASTLKGGISLDCSVEGETIINVEIPASD